MGKITRSPEVSRVYVGSYWDEPLQHTDYEGLFKKDSKLLIEELKQLPASAAARKINDFVVRIRTVKVSHLEKHCCGEIEVAAAELEFAFSRRESRSFFLRSCSLVVSLQSPLSTRFVLSFLSGSVVCESV